MVKKIFKYTQLGLNEEDNNFMKAHEIQKAIDSELCGKMFFITNIAEEHGKIIVEYELE